MEGYYKAGDNYFLCPMCGFKKRVSDGCYRWDQEFVCKEDWEARHPQESIGARGDSSVPRISRPEPSDTFIDVLDVKKEDL